MSARDRDRLVYSTQAAQCPRCRRMPNRCKCGEKVAARAAPVSTPGQFVYVGRESKGRRGKTVTTISGLPFQGEELKTLAGELKRLCGTGGAVKAGVVEVQGDHRDFLVAELERRDFKVKRKGA